MRIDARWSEHLRPFDETNESMSGTGWLIELSEDGYLLELDAQQPAVVSRREADRVGLQFVNPRSGEWVEHDDPAILAYIATLPD